MLGVDVSRAAFFQISVLHTPCAEPARGAVSAVVCNCIDPWMIRWSELT